MYLSAILIVIECMDSRVSFESISISVGKDILGYLLVKEANHNLILLCISEPVSANKDSEVLRLPTPISATSVYTET